MSLVYMIDRMARPEITTNFVVGKALLPTLHPWRLDASVQLFLTLLGVAPQRACNI